MYLIFITTCIAIHAVGGEELPVVKTPYGDIQGTYSLSYEGVQYSQFLGVPYAQPPIGDLRFKEPQPLQKWSGIWNASLSTLCIQIFHLPDPEGGNVMGQEDCLYLNIFVPNKNAFKSKRLDVIVHIHGGAFNFASGNTYAGPKYLMDINVILVTMNYRLGPLGFLSTEDDVVPGNNGMKDQVASLKWIKENIKYFGGNSDSITITGLSAGGLFHRGISSSGSALCPWSMQENALEKARRLAATVGCMQSISVDLVKCLRQRPAEQIVENVRMFRPWLYNPFSPFGVVVEKAGDRPFLNDNPHTLISQGKVQDLPWLTSVTPEEGLYPTAEFLFKKNYLADLERRWTELASAVLDYNYTLPTRMHADVANNIKEYYLKGKPISMNTYEELIQMVGDRHFVVPVEKAARLQAKVNKSPVYFYYFTYVGENTPSFAMNYSGLEYKYGVSHGDDLMFILSTPSKEMIKMTATDERMKDVLLGIWRSFAKTGSPKVDNVVWMPVSEANTPELNYMHIKSPSGVEMKSTKDLGNCAFWDRIPFQENENLMKAAKEEL